MDLFDYTLPPINKDATRKRVERALETARVYKQIGFVRREHTITHNYDARYHGATHFVGKPVESVAGWNVDAEARISKVTSDVEQAVARLEGSEQDIVRKRYLDRSDVLDSILCYELGMSERTYRRYKAKAIFKLAWMLGLEVPADRTGRSVVS